MSGFKEPSFADRQKAAMQARQNILNRFRAQPGPDDPEVKRRQAEREAQAAARAKVREAKEAEKAEQKRREAEAAAAEAARIAREKEEEAAETRRARGRTEGQARRALRRAQKQGQEEVERRQFGISRRTHLGRGHFRAFSADVLSAIADSLLALRLRDVALPPTMRSVPCAEVRPDQRDHRSLQSPQSADKRSAGARSGRPPAAKLKAEKLALHPEK